MNLETIRTFLGWCALINIGFLLYWFFLFIVAGKWMHTFTSKILDLSVSEFNLIHYTLMGIFKLAIIFFNLVPYLALHIID